MSVPTVSWDETAPAGSQAISLGDNRIRELKTQIRELVGVDHDFPSSGTAADNGQHLQVTLQEQADLGTGAVGATILGSQTVGGKGELVYTDEDDNDIQITSGGKVYLALSELTDGRLANDTYLKAVDNAGTGTVDILKVTTGDVITVGAVTTLPDTSALATSGAPAADAQIANKKYVDDQVAGLAVAYSTGLGAWLSRADATSYLAATDGFVTAWAVGGAHIVGYTDGSDPPTTMRTQDDSGATESGICFPVRAGDYWKVSGSSGIFWIPLS